MRINEYVPVNGKFFNKGLQEDQFYPLALRRPRLTLTHLSKLRKIRDLRRIGQLRHAMNLPIMNLPKIKPQIQIVNQSVDKAL